MKSPRVINARAEIETDPRYWWVNHKQTFAHEVGGGYLWSPKRNRNGAQNRTYDNMTRVRVGEVVFSYASGYIRAVGHVISTARASRQPAEFGRAGKSWSKHEGWKVAVRFNPLTPPFRPASHMQVLARFLPPTHSPIRANGKGNQGVYLTEIPRSLAESLQALMHGTPPRVPERDNIPEREREELASVQRIQRSNLRPTIKRRLIAARVGQGLFRQNVEALEAACRVTGITDRRFLRASHIRPWCRSNNKERLDGNNGLLLAPHIDHLFDGAYISFADDGTLLVSSLCPPTILSALGVRVPLKVGAFRPEQLGYLRYHRSMFHQHERTGRKRQPRKARARRR